MKLYQEALNINIQYKELNINNYKILNDLYKEFVKDTSKKTKFKYKNKTLDKKINELKEAKQYKILVAYNNDTPIGYIMGSIDDKMKSGVFNGAIRSLVVSKDYRRMGIAKKLYSILDKWFNTNNIKIKWVTSLYGNKEAINLYMSLGFVGEMLVMRQ